MNKDKIPTWLSTTLLVALFSFLGWMGIQIYQINGKVSSFDIGLKNLETRVDNISDSLPLLQVRVAKEELSRPFKTAIVVGKPTSTGNEWKSKVYVVDSKTNKVKTYSIPLKDENDSQASITASGSVNLADSNAISFQELKELATSSGTTFQFPLNIQPEASYVLKSKNAATKVEENLKKMSQTEKTTELKSKINAASDLPTMVLENPNIFNGN